MKQKNKLLFALMGATLLSANALAETQAPSLVAYDVNGDGTIAEGEKAYELKSADDLYWFANFVNDMANAEYNNVFYQSSANAVLTANITVNENLLESLAFDEKGNVTNGADFGEWSLIGYYNSDVDYVFYAGTFDGNGHTISGLYFNNSSAMCVGLFGSIYGATIKNVGVIDSYFKGSWYIGGVCGYNYGNGTIENCYNTGEISGGNGSNCIGGVCGNNKGTIENCYNTGKVSGGDGSYYIGGVCGDNYGSIENCYNSGEVSGGDSVGGVCGYNSNGTITNCYNTGEVSGGSNIGGVCGFNYNGTITNCYNTGEVSGGDGSYYIGGVCGINLGTIKNCYNTGKVSGGNESSEIGGVCGYNKVEGSITNCYYLDSSASVGIGYDVTGEGEATAKTAEEFANGTVAQSLRNGTNGDVWGQYIGVDKSPKLTGVFCPKQIAEGDYAGYYAISNADELYWFAGLVNGKIVGVEQNTSANAVLTANITVNENLLESLAFDENGNVTNGDDFKAWSPIGYNVKYDYYYYKGKFDGNGHKISGLFFDYHDTQYNMGLFGDIYGATIKNLGVIDSYFSCSVEWTLGGICGYNNGGTIENCYYAGEVRGTKSVGGVCGENHGTITNCYNSGKVSGGNDSYNIGGVCGYSYEGTITNCYNAGEISGDKYFGGVCGYNYEGSIKNCYDFKLNSGTLSEYSIVVKNNAIALPTEDMVSLEGYIFGGWYNNADCEGEVIISEEEFDDDEHILYAKWIEGSTPTAIKAVEAESNKTIKTIKDGQIVIIRNGVMYDMQGRKL